jgi:transposase
MQVPYLLSDRHWAVIEPLLPHLGGKPRVDDRLVISGILYRFREGLRWRAIPVGYGPRTTLFNRFNRWSQRGLWRELLAALAARDDPPDVAMVDSTTMRAHRAAAGAKGGERGQAIGHSRGGRTTKLHALADGQGRLYALMLTPGQVHDIVGGRALLVAVPPMRRLIGDKAYDANDLRDFLAGQGTEAVIPPMPQRKTPPPFDPIAYRRRNVIERAFCQLKDWRGIATRYDKTARNFLAGICLAVAVAHWLG